ncbi:AraC-type DNA-binding protein [Pedobacter westerhofensis]|uniref:AraC-type DNA-binding protein n=1 Tax=Pedobacter westerhofensis TaxID=425512 RepID=A0A521FL09_9SPHI|nr:AraC family transcriptional regulator [Pedobacter westerhofensis]SMO96902.1 AraC-type DNA-binding protein [Pedobacter westerhofensis]
MSNFTVMDKIKTFSLTGHGHLFAVPDTSRDYLFVQAVNHPYLEEPYRAESYALAYVKEGSINLQAGLSQYLIEAPSMISLSPSMIRSFRKSADLMKMDIIFFKDSFLLEGNRNLFFLMEYDFFENSELTVVPLADDLHIKVKGIFELMRMSQASPGYHVSDISRSYIMVLLYEIDTWHRISRSKKKMLDQIYPLFAKFKKLLTRNYMNERKLDFYADHLHVTPKYLSVAIKKHTGKSAAQWINESVTLEAKVLLQDLTLTVSQISNQLNFTDQSTFGKFFKANTGFTPVGYRKGL